MLDDTYKEVDFYTHCKTCKHKNVKEKDSPCNECLEEPTNLHSNKPVRWEDDTDK